MDGCVGNGGDREIQAHITRRTSKVAWGFVPLSGQRATRVVPGVYPAATLVFLLHRINGSHEARFAHVRAPADYLDTTGAPNP